MQDKLLTFPEFMHAFKDMNKIGAIYIDDDKDTLFSDTVGTENPYDRLHQDTNILSDDKYLYLENGEYVINKEKIISDFAEYKVSIYYPQIKSENTEMIAEISDKATDDYDYIRKVEPYIINCEIIIRPPRTTDNIDSVFFPKIDSKINCIILEDYHMYDEDDDDVEIDGIPAIIGVVPLDAKVDPIINKRRGLYTVAIKIKRGTPQLDESIVYYTDILGKVSEIGALSVMDDCFDLEEDEGDINEED